MAQFVVNPHGTVHSIPDEWLPDHLKRGFRMATVEEIRHWYEMQGLEFPEVSDGESEHEQPDQPGERPYRRSRRS